MGLELSAVSGITQHHNGSVDEESGPGQGATFYLQIGADRLYRRRER